MNDKEEMDEYVKLWCRAKRVIEGLLKELRPDMSKEHLDHNSSALIARLSNAEISIVAFEGK